MLTYIYDQLKGLMDGLLNGLNRREAYRRLEGCRHPASFARHS
jgi:hypothetical protein